MYQKNLEIQKKTWHFLVLKEQIKKSMSIPIWSVCTSDFDIFGAGGKFPFFFFSLSFFSLSFLNAFSIWSNLSCVSFSDNFFRPLGSSSSSEIAIGDLLLSYRFFGSGKSSPSGSDRILLFLSFSLDLTLFLSSELFRFGDFFRPGGDFFGSGDFERVLYL